MACNGDPYVGGVTPDWFRLPAAQLTALAEFADRLPVPIVVLECTGQLCFANRAAQAELDRIWPQVCRAAEFLCPWAPDCSGAAACSRQQCPTRAVPITLKHVLPSDRVLEIHATWLSPEGPGAVLVTWTITRVDSATPTQEYEPMPENATPNVGHLAGCSVEDLLARLDAVQANAETTARFARAEGDTLCGELRELHQAGSAFLEASSRVSGGLDRLEVALQKLAGRPAAWASAPPAELAELRKALAAHLALGQALYESTLRAIEGTRRVGEIATDLALEASSLVQLALQLMRA